MKKNRGTCAIAGYVHDPGNILLFKDAARQEAVRKAQSQGLEAPWLVDVSVYNEGGPHYVAAVANGQLVSWREAVPADELDPDDGGVIIGFSHGELVRGVEEHRFVVVEEGERVKVAALVDEPGRDFTLVVWERDSPDEKWYWARTMGVAADWIGKIMAQKSH